jgi:Ca2+-binding EF-hand superfamily protein
MQTNIHHQKMEHLFRSFDHNGNGYLEKRDLESMADRVASGHPAGRDAAKRDQLKSSFQTFWQAISPLDKDNDGRVSRDEFVNYFHQLAKDTKATPSQVVSAISNALFLSADSDGNGSISPEEFKTICKAYKVSDENIKKAFDMHARTNKSQLSRSEWDALVKEMFYSTDANSGGSLLLMSV